jgi:cullin-associated NEDD8-dissociated protein 1
VAFELEIAGETVSSVKANLPKYQQAIADSIDGVDANQVEITIDTPHSLRRFLIVGVVLKITILSDAVAIADAIEVAVKAPSFVSTLSSELVKEGITVRGALTIDTTKISTALVTGKPPPPPFHWKNCTYDTFAPVRLSDVTATRSGDRWVDIWSNDTLSSLVGSLKVGVSYTMVFKATSTCTAGALLGMSGDGGWMAVTIAANADGEEYSVNGKFPSGVTTSRFQFQEFGSACNITIADAMWHQTPRWHGSWFGSQPTGFPMSVTSGMILPQSSPNQLLFLQQVSSECVVVPVARSYDGRAWEGMMPKPLEPTCTGVGATSACSVVVPEDQRHLAHYRVVTFDATAEGLARGSRHAVSRLLRQVTYGPSTAGIDRFLDEYGSPDTTSVTKWVHDQMAMTPTLTREYYRHRVNNGVRSMSDRVIKPCSVGSRWHRDAFISSDYNKQLDVSEGTAGMLELRIDGVLRAEVNATDWPRTERTGVNNTYTLCYHTSNGNPDSDPKSVAGPADPIPGDWVIISLNTACGKPKFTVDGGSRFRVLHPAIHFSKPDPSNTISFSSGDVKLASITKNPANLMDQWGVGAAVVITELNVRECAANNILKHHGLVFMQTPTGKFYKYEYRLGLLDNKVELPAEVAATAGEDDAVSTCPSATKSYLNKGQCVRTSGCAPSVFSSATLLLDDHHLRTMYNLSTRHVYYVTGLRTEGHRSFSPCDPDRGRSRWLKLDGACTDPTPLNETTRQSLVDALFTSTDANPFVRDINIPAGVCVTEQDGVSTVGSKVDINGTCWEHVHPDTYSVRDFNYWAYYHPGGSPAIERMAKENSTLFAFPASHPMSRWELHKPKLPYLGRYGDERSFDALPTEVQTMKIARWLGALEDSSHRQILACGSPGEVRNKPELGNHFEFIEAGGYDSKEFRHITRIARSMVVLNAAFYAEDQLRQRMAWALSQIFTIGMDGTQRQHITEVWLVYFDIFTRHAFGNFRNIVRDVAYSPMMGEFLTHKNNKAYAASGTYPDENFAREIMQLFTLGLHKLNLDGTPILGTNGEPIPAYDNDDITTFARIWTGFAINGDRRSNTEGAVLSGGGNAIDPMRIKGEWRDKFPKTKLEAGYIGDKSPLCSDLPPRPFLAKGATFRYIGNCGAGGCAFDARRHTYNHLRLKETAKPSTLFHHLCKPDASSGACTFPDEVVLSELLNCTDVECRLDSMQGVQITKGGVSGWYQFILPPCVRLAFTATRFWSKFSFRTVGGYSYQCADPLAPVASGLCCNKLTGDVINTRTSTPNEHQTEYVTLATLQARCEAKNQRVCTDHSLSNGNIGTCREMHMWTDRPCRPQIQVRANGWINIVETPPTGGKSHASFSLNSPEKFRIWWEGGAYPMHKDSCGEGCTQAAGETCLCDITVETAAAFTDSTRVPTVAELNAALFIGSVAPDTLNNELHSGSAYRKCTSAICTANAEVDVYFKEPHTTRTETTSEAPSMAPTGVLTAAPTRLDASLLMDADTIFEYRSAITGLPVYLRNKASAVTVGSSGFSFRNPPHFLSLLGESKNNNPYDNLARAREAEYEVEALLDHLTQHPSVAPHICKLLIQRFVTSNPSPRYVKVVASAFTTGMHAGRTYSGVYGDLGAAAVALITDPEARSMALDADVTYGGTREPWLRTIHYLRAFDYKPYFGAALAMPGIQMNAFCAPTVFGFYRQDYTPAGPVDELGLVSPEAELCTAPSLIQYLNGIKSLVTIGLSAHNGGMGDHNRLAFAYAHHRHDKIVMSGDGNLTYMPPKFPASRKITSCDSLGSRRWCTSSMPAIVLGTVDTPAACNALCKEHDLTGTSFPSGCCRWNPRLITLSASAYGCAGAGCPAGQLVDGQRSGGSFWHSGWNQPNPFIQIDLGEALPVTEVQIYHRLQMGMDLFGYHEIWISDDATTPREKCFGAKGGNSCGYLKSCVPCLGTGRYIRIILPGSSRTMMAFEVEVSLKLPGTCALLPSGAQEAVSALNQWSGKCIESDKASYRQALVENAPEVIEDLSLLLADGRMSNHTKGTLEKAYVSNVLSWTDAQLVGMTEKDVSQRALEVIQELVAAVPEFHTTSLNIAAGERPPRVPQEAFGRKFKAIVVVNLHGGADSFNFLVPYSNCPELDLYEEYRNVRGNVALSKSELLQIDVPTGTQPCDTFALNPKFVNTKQLYVDGDAAWVANIGTLVEPMTVTEFKTNKKRKPPSLFGHAQQRVQVQTSVPQDPNAKGVLGRAVKSLMDQASPYKSQLFNVGGSGKILTGSPSTPIGVGRGITRWARAGGSMNRYLNNITEQTSHSIFAETYAASTGLNLHTQDELADQLASKSVTTSFPNSGLGSSLMMVSRLVKVAKAQQTERAVFMTGIYGFDTHGSAEDRNGPILIQKMQEFDDAVKAFSDEMKAQGMWDDVVLVTVSDFGRSLSSNSAAGTDHGWGGNNVLIGGGLKGGQVFGQYPSRLQLGKGQDIGRGRLVPTMGWEGIWCPILKWYGVHQNDMPVVLPNLANFAQEQVVASESMFN